MKSSHALGVFGGTIYAAESPAGSAAASWWKLSSDTAVQWGTMGTGPYFTTLGSVGRWSANACGVWDKNTPVRSKPQGLRSPLRSSDCRDDSPRVADSDGEAAEEMETRKREDVRQGDGARKSNRSCAGEGSLSLEALPLPPRDCRGTRGDVFHIAHAQRSVSRGSPPPPPPAAAVAAAAALLLLR
ncbi:unnamed protein product [Lampetra planeri]